MPKRKRKKNENNRKKNKKKEKEKAPLRKITYFLLDVLRVPKPYFRVKSKRQNHFHRLIKKQNPVTSLVLAIRRGLFLYMS
jgi:hypothetical protein